MRTVGVEEELLLVDPTSGEARAVAGTALRRAEQLLVPGDPAPHDPPPGGAIEAELQQQQLETETTPQTDLRALEQELRAQRRLADRAAAAAGARVAALATSPLPVTPRTTPKDRYLRMAAQFGLTLAEQLTCGCHVHVA